MRALIYTRVSRDPKRRGRSVAEQEAECRAACAREGWKVIDVIKDSNRSASRHAKRSREGWSEVKARLAAGHADVLVTWECSRAQRDLEAYVELRGLCRRHGVRWSYSGRTYDLDDVNDSFSAGVDALVAEREADETRRRILRTVRANANRGRPHGRRGYGYRRVYDETTGELLRQEPEPEEAAIIRELARRVLAGESGYSITEDLNRRQVPTMTGVPWELTAIKRIVTSERVAGLRVHRGKVIGEADWDPILDRDTWERVRAVYADPRRDQFRVGRDIRHLLSGIARCGECGGRMYRAHDRGRMTYACRDGKGHVTASMTLLDAFVTAAVVRRLEKDSDGWVPNVDDPDVLEARATLERLRAKKQEARDAYNADGIDIDDLMLINDDLRPKIADAERRSKVGAASSAAAEMAGPGAAHRWSAATVEQRREVLKAGFNVVVHRSTRPRGTRGLDESRVSVTKRH